MIEKSRIRWLCRRGMKELDVLLERFFVAEYDGLDAAGQAAFVGLLEREDPDLWALLMGRMAVDDERQAALLERIRRFEGLARV